MFGGAFTTADRAGETLIVPPGGIFIMIVSTIEEGYPVLAATAGLGLAIVLATAVLARRQARP